MRELFNYLISFVLIWQLVAGTSLIVVSAQTNQTQNIAEIDKKNSDKGQEPKPGTQQPTAPYPAPKPLQPAAGQGAENGTSDNGITVGKPKQFDERTLTLMLQSLEEKLARTQFPDTSGLFGNVGRFSGATANTTAMSLSIKGQGLPSIETTLDSSNKDINKTTTGTESTLSTEVSATGTKTTTGGKNTGTSELTNEANSSNKQVIKQPEFAAPTAALPGQTSLFSYQPQFGIAAQDLLAEQTSLFYQIVNLRLLLDRSLTDRLDVGQIARGADFAPRNQVVLGFQISIDASYKDAVAEAEIEVSGDNAKLVSLLPQDKTYNVASVTKDSKAIDLGAVVQFIGVGAAASKTQESLYLVKDTDTVALERPGQSNSIKFAWQFRPVLGRRAVEPGMRQVFALISVPGRNPLTGNASLWNGKIKATTKWRRYDRKTKTVGKLIGGTNEEKEYDNIELPATFSRSSDFALRPRVHQMSWSDLGNGQILVVAEGEGFTPDTSLVVGNTVLDRPENGLIFANERRLLVRAPAQLLGQSPPLIVGRYGTNEFIRSSFKCYYDIEVGDACKDFKKSYSDDLDLVSPVIIPRDPLYSEVKLKLTPKVGKTPDLKYRFKHHKPVVVIGGRVFGLSDAPFTQTNYLPDTNPTSVEFTFIAPTQLLADSKLLTFKEFLWNDGEINKPFELADKFIVTSLSNLGTNGDTVQLAIFGGGFTDDIKVKIGETLFTAKACTVADGTCTKGIVINGTSGTSTMLSLSPTKAQIKDVKQIVVSQGTAQPLPLLLTQPPPPVPMAKIILPAAESFSVNRGDSVRVKFQGANFESIKKVFFEGREVVSKPDEEDKTALWVDLQTFITGESGTKRIVFQMKDDKEVPFMLKVN